MEVQTAMHPDEKEIRDALDAINNGDEEKLYKIRSQTIFPAKALRWLVKVRGKDVIQEWNLKTDEAEREYGKDWLNQFN